MATEEEKREATYNYLKTNFEYSRRKFKQRKIIFLVSITIIISLVLFIYSIGGIYIPFSASNYRYYDVRLNGVQVSTLSYAPDRTLIKNLIYLSPTHTSDLLHWPTKETDEARKIKANKYKLSVQSYSCHYMDVIVDCRWNKENEQLKKVNTDTKYKLRIYSHKDLEQISTIGEFPNDISDRDKFYNLIYEDKYINDITSYIVEKGQYVIEIEARYGFQIQNLMIIMYNDGNSITVF